MQAAVERLDAWDVTLRDIETGLVDFPALVAGRQVWLCWRLGEGGYAKWGPRNLSVRPRKLPARIPATWWTAAEQLLRRRKGSS